MFFGKIFGAIASIALIRYLGVERQGIYSYILSVIFIFGFLTEFGISSFLTREARISGKKGEIIFGNALLLQVFQILLSVGIINIYGALFGINSEIKFELFLASIAMNLGYAALPFTAVLNSYEKMYFTGAASVAASIMNALFIFAAINMEFSIAQILIMLGISNLLNVIISAFLCFRFTIKPVFNIEWKVMRDIFRGCIPFAIIALFNSVYTKIDVLLLFKMKPAAEVGYYTATTKVMDILIMLTVMIASPLYPRLSYLFTKRTKVEAARVINLSMKYLMGIVAPFALMITMFNYEYTLLLLGEEFLKSRYAFAIIIWIIFLVSAHAIPTHALNASRFTRLIIYVYGINIFLNLGLNLIFIPEHSYIATSCVIVLCNIVIFAWTAYFVNRKIGKVNAVLHIVRIAAGLLLPGLFWYFTKGKASYILLSAAGIFIYAVVMFSIRYIDGNDIKIFMNILKKEK